MTKANAVLRKISDLVPDNKNAACVIYALVDPRDNRIRYVGKATDPQRRLRRHVMDARQGKADHKSNWIAALLRQDMKPILHIIEICSHDQWKERERFWIAEMRRNGSDLTNSKDGGDGLEPNDAARAKMSAAKLGKIPHNKGAITPDDVRAKQSEAARRRWDGMSPEEKRQYMEPALQHPPEYRPEWHHSDVAKQKISASLKGNSRTLGRKMSDEERKMRSASLVGRVVSDETRQKISQTKRSKRQSQDITE